MVPQTRDYWVFGLCQLSSILKNTTLICIGVYGFGLLVQSVSSIFHFRFYLSFRFVHALSQFLLYIFLLSPTDEA
jgi:hypothetical protein